MTFKEKSFSKVDDKCLLFINSNLYTLTVDEEITSLQKGLVVNYYMSHIKQTKFSDFSFLFPTHIMWYHWKHFHIPPN